MNRKYVSLLWATLIYLATSCAYNDISVRIDCTNSDLSIALDKKSDATSCKAIDGVLSVVASGGKVPYDFSINSGTYQTNPTFENLAPGEYIVTVKDFEGCKVDLTVEINAANSNLAASVISTEDNQCLTDNGTATIQATGGNPPYRFQIDASGFGTANTFSGLRSGQHVVIVKDNEDCQKVLGIVIARGSTGISYKNEIKPIFDANCNLSGCHDASTGGRDWTNFTNVKNNAGNIKTRTGNKTMPVGDKTLTQQQINLIACWVDDGALNN